MRDLHKYYQLPIHGKSLTRKQIETTIKHCRMPIVTLVPNHLEYLYGIMQGLFNAYYALLKNAHHGQTQKTFIRKYIECLDKCTGESHRSEWLSCPLYIRTHFYATGVSDGD